MSESYKYQLVVQFNHAPQQSFFSDKKPEIQALTKAIYSNVIVLTDIAFIKVKSVVLLELDSNGIYIPADID